MMAITPDNVAGMRYAAQIPKKETTPKPKVAATPKPKAVTPKPKAPALPKTISSGLSKIEQESTAATAAIDAAIAEADAAAAAGDVLAAEGNAALAQTRSTPTTTAEDLIAKQEADRIAEADRRDRQSAYDILYNEFNRYGLGSLVEDVKYLIQSNVSPSQFSLELQNTKAYQNRFAANKERIVKGLSALSPAEYIGLEDQYQNIMRNYGLPDSYYTKDSTGKQAGFEKFIAGDVSAVELEDRISTAQNRVLNSNPEVLQSLKSFYPDITNSDVLAYTLDPKNALENIKRKVTAAEIGGAATQAGLSTGMTRAEELAAAGINKAQAQQGFQAVAQVAPRGGQLAAIYGESPYTQQTAEQEVFGLAGSAEAAKQRKKLVGLEQATFSAKSGAAQGALQRERAGNL